jgi:hypothetical protein
MPPGIGSDNESCCWNGVVWTKLESLLGQQKFVYHSVAVVIDVVYSLDCRRFDLRVGVVSVCS